jgi:ATP adenylyltransferase
MEYILSDQKEGDCIFCPGDNRSEDEARLILHVGHLSMVMMNRFPYINGHLLVAPVRHVGGLELLSQEEKLNLLNMVSMSVEILRKAMSPEGFNVGLNLGKVAGAEKCRATEADRQHTGTGKRADSLPRHLSSSHGQR